MQKQAGYTYAAEPRAVQPRKKFREPTQPDKPGNMMFDRRIVRGNTYSAQTLPLSTTPETTKLSKEADKKKRTMVKSREAKLAPPPPSTPDPVTGRKHIEVQTEQYLEELSDKVEEKEISTQTDYFLDRPTSPLFIPVKTGIDATTQIEDDLFDFDHEVSPILDVLLGKTLEQAMLEVLEEDEIHNIRLHRDQMQQTRNAELAATQQLEEMEKRKFEEKERRKEQERAREAREKETTAKVAATAFARDYLKSIETTVMSSLSEAGYFVDPAVAQVETAFLPWLMERVNVSIDKARVARALADDLLHKAHEIGTVKHQRLVAAIMVNRARRDEHRRRLAERHTEKSELGGVHAEDGRSRAVMEFEAEEARKAELARQEAERQRLLKEQEEALAAQQAEDERLKKEAEDAEKAAQEGAEGEEGGEGEGDGEGEGEGEGEAPEEPQQ